MNFKEAHNFIQNAMEFPELLRDFDVNNPEFISTADVKAPLIMGAKNLEQLKFLLENGADINSFDSFAYTPLKNSIQDNDFERFNYLISKGVKLDFDPLITAIAYFRHKMLITLLNRGADLNGSVAKNSLEKAIYHNNQTALKILINRGANKTLVSDEYIKMAEDFKLSGILNNYKYESELETQKKIEQYILAKCEDDQNQHPNAVKKRLEVRHAPKPKQPVIIKETLFERADRLINVVDKLKTKIFGQDKSLDELKKFILSELLDDNRKSPLVVAFFGPSGVGKTATAEELSFALNKKPAKIISMSEYSSEFKISNLTGSAMGYVGSDNPGILGDFIHNNPNGVLVLDEFEKAHPAAQQLFLNLFDKGIIRDTKKGDLNFRNTTIILTSNAGVVSNKTVGFNSGPEKMYVDMKKINNSFPPELLGRINATLVYESLNSDSLLKIVDKIIKSFESYFKKLNTQIVLSNELKNHFAKQGMHPSQGARPLRNMIKTEIRSAAATAAYQNNFQPCVLTFDLDKDGRIFYKSEINNINTTRQAIIQNVHQNVK